MYSINNVTIYNFHFLCNPKKKETDNKKRYKKWEGTTIAVIETRVKQNIFRVYNIIYNSNNKNK